MRASEAALFALALCAAAARAADPDTPAFSLSGFGTLGMVHSTEDQADFTGSPSRPRGAGYSRAWSPEVDSLVGVQFTGLLAPRLSAVLQVISEQDHDHSYRPHLEWANLKYQLIADLELRVGRTVLPILMVTDSRKVGYALPWVRPPVEVYGLVPYTNNDGIDASYGLRVGHATNTVQVGLGRSDPRFPMGSAGATTTAQVREAVSLTDTYEHGFATARLHYGQARLTLSGANALFDAFRRFGPEGVALAERYDVRDSLVTVFGAGASFDPGPWFVMGEWTRTQSDTVRGTKSGGYVSAGVRAGKFAPYVVYARARADNLSDPGLTVAGLPPGQALVAGALNASLNAALRTKPVQDTVSLGVRWDVARNLALKFQYDRTRIGAGSTGVLGNIQPGFRSGGKLDLFTATMDFVFR